MLLFPKVSTGGFSCTNNVFVVPHSYSLTNFFCLPVAWLAGSADFVAKLAGLGVRVCPPQAFWLFVKCFPARVLATSVTGYVTKRNYVQQYYDVTYVPLAVSTSGKISIGWVVYEVVHIEKPNDSMHLRMECSCVTACTCGTVLQHSLIPPLGSHPIQSTGVTSLPQVDLECVNSSWRYY
jgi:hypothetical protein